LPAIEGSERDNTQDWIVPRGTVPTVAELEARIDEAVIVARASEEGVREVGEMAIDAAKQARRAAEAAEVSAQAATAAAREAASSAAGAAGPVAAGDPPPAAKQQGAPPTTPPPGRGGEEQSLQVEEEPSREVVIDPLQRFNQRADALAARLEKLQQA
jgi:hypothetical protein